MIGYALLGCRISIWRCKGGVGDANSRSVAAPFKKPLVRSVCSVAAPLKKPGASQRATCFSTDVDDDDDGGSTVDDSDDDDLCCHCDGDADTLFQRSAVDAEPESHTSSLKRRIVHAL